MKFIVGYFVAIGAFLAVTAFVWPMLPFWLGVVGIGGFVILWAILSLSGYEFRHPPQSGTNWNWEGKTDE